MSELPYGSWPSPISVDDVVAAGASFSDVRADGASLSWLTSVPEQDSRLTLTRRDGTGAQRELTPAPINVRSRVHEYGGGAWDRRGGVSVVCDDASARLLVVTEAATDPVTPPSRDVRFGDLRVYPEHDLVLAVREDHRGDAEPTNTLVALALSADNADFGQVLAEGADFYAGPVLSDDGRVAWFEWDHPNMPWDDTRVVVAPLRRGDSGEWVRGPALVVSGDHESAIHPAWLPPGSTGPAELVYATDTSGYWNLTRWTPELGAVTCLDLVADMDTPPWNLGSHVWAVVDGETIAVSWLVDGAPRLGMLNLQTGTLTGIDGPDLADVNSLAVTADGRVFGVVGYVDRPAELAEITDTGPVTIVASPAPTPAAESVSRPQALWLDGASGPVHAWYYPPLLAGVTAPSGELPPLIVKSHGGPTGMASVTYDADKQFWTSRGFAIVDVNYSGSAGFGRAYRKRLAGQWGIADVSDCADAVAHCVASGLADPARIAITGGSAGGYTTLQSLVTRDIYTAGVSRYGIGDLLALAHGTHKFESRYVDGLVGPLPAAEAAYAERSPIHHVQDISAPMLILQGADDHVVPPQQATEMAAAVESKGLPVALQIYPGEGHGFRRLVTRRSALEAQVSFLAQLWRFVPADDVPVLAITNLR